MNKKIMMVLFALCVVSIIPAVQGADYEYCSYSTNNCNRIAVGIQPDVTYYDCDQGECIGIIDKGSSQTIECVDGTSPTADIFIHSYTPLCDAKCVSGANQYDDGETYCEGNQIKNCVIDYNSCVATPTNGAYCDPASSSSCQPAGVGQVKCDCATNECPYDGYKECSGTNAEKVCRTNAAGCKYWAYNEQGSTCLQGETCKQPGGVNTGGSCSCDNECNVDECTGGNFPLNQFKECLTYQGSTCTYLGSTQTCEGNEECVGSGDCICPQTCQDGTQSCGDTPTTLKICDIWSGDTCPSYGDTQPSCPIAFGSILQECNPQSNQCECPTADAPLNSRECTGGPDGITKQYRVYAKQGNDACPSWGPTVSCPNSQDVCNNGMCGCPATNNQLYGKDCVGAFSYIQWECPGGTCDINECPTWSTEKLCPTSTGSLKQTCDTLTDECVCPTTQNIPDVSRTCDGNEVMMWKYKQGDNCPSWQPVTDCSLTGQLCSSGSCGCPSTPGLDVGDKTCDGTWNYFTYDNWGQTCPSWSTTSTKCPEGYMCYEAVENKGQCIEIFNKVTIISDESYPVNEPITGITVIINREIGNAEGISIDARLLSQGVELPGSRVQTFIQNSEATLNFEYAHPLAPADLTIEVVVGKGTYQETKVEKGIKIEGKLAIFLSSNPAFAGFIGRDIEVTWDVEDARTGTPISVPNPKVTIMQGSTQIFGTPLGTYGIRFQTMELGWVKTTVEVDKEGWIGDTAELDLEIKGLTWNVEMEIDNEPFGSYSGSGIETGTHRLQLSIFESGELIEPQQIDATIRTPSGETKNLYFTKVEDGVYKHNTFDFDTAGVSYDFEAEVKLKDLTKEGPPPFKAKIATLQGNTDVKDLTTYFIIGGAVVAVLLIIVIIVVLSKRRKQK